MILLNQSGILLRIILVLAILLRMVWIWQEVSIPEAANIRVALLPMFEIPLELFEGGYQPPLYPFLLSAFAMVSDHILWLRLSSVLAGVLLVVWMFRLGSYWGTATGNLAAFLAAISPLFIVISSELVHAVWACLFAAMALYYFWRWVQTRRAEALFVYELCLLLLLYTCYIGIYWFIAFNVLFLATRVCHRAFFDVFWKRWWVNQLLIVLLYLPWFLQLPGHIAFPRSGLDGIHALHGLLTPLSSFFNVFPGFPFGLVLAGLAFLVLAGHHVRASRSVESRPEVARHLSLVLLPIVLFVCSLAFFSRTIFPLDPADLVSGGIPVTLLLSWSIIQLLPQKEGS